LYIKQHNAIGFHKAQNQLTQVFSDYKVLHSPCRSGSVFTSYSEDEYFT